MDENYYIALINKFFLGLITEEDEVLLKNWINDPKSEKIFAQHSKNKWDAVSDTMDSEVQYRMLRNILMQIETSQKVKTKLPSQQIKLRLIYKSIAAACLLIAFCAGSYYWGVNNERSYLTHLSPVSLTVENGQKAEVVLSDGTVVYINSGSKLRYDNQYGRNDRIINLEGEAYFNVAPDKEKPFIVNARELNVEALGTSFNVKSYPSDKNIVVTLIEGSVKVNDAHNEVLMAVNDRLEYEKEDKIFIKDKILPNSDNLLWRSKELAFYDESLESICKVLSRLYDVEFIIEDGNIKADTFTGIIKNNSLYNVLDLLSLSASINYTVRSDNTILIRPK